MTRRSELVELSVHELVSRLLHAEWRAERLESELDRTRKALSRAQCGDVVAGTSCQLPRNHDGLHAHEDGNGVLMRWG